MLAIPSHKHISLKKQHYINDCDVYNTIIYIYIYIFAHTVQECVYIYICIYIRKNILILHTPWWLPAIRFLSLLQLLLSCFVVVSEFNPPKVVQFVWPIPLAF